MLAYLEPLSVSACGRPSCGPSSFSSSTVAMTSTWASSSRSANHSSNSAVVATSHIPTSSLNGYDRSIACAYVPYVGVLGAHEHVEAARIDHQEAVQRAAETRLAIRETAVERLRAIAEAEKRGSGR